MIELHNNSAFGGGCKNVFISCADIANLLSANVNGGSILVLAGYNNIHIEGCSLGMNSNNGNPIELYGVGDVANPSANTHFYFRDNNVIGPFSKSGYFVGKKVHITDNDFFCDIQLASAGGNENLADPALAFTSDSIVFDGNTIDTKTGTTSSAYVAIVAGAHPYTAHITSDIVLSNNVFKDGFLKISDSDGDSGYVEEFARISVKANHFWSAYQSNIQLICRGNTMTMNNLSIDDNTFYQWNSSNVGARYAIQIASLAAAAPNGVIAFSRASIRGNKFGPGMSGRTVAIRIQNGNTTFNSFTGSINVDNNDFSGVTITEDTPGIFVYNNLRTISTQVTQRSAATTLDATHCSIELNTAATQTLPALATCQGRMYEFVNINAAAATIKGSGTKLIGNVTTANADTPPSGAAVTLKAFPSAWRVVSS
ncbi:hypothetical protein [Rathayibacter sp. Leaf248]|uniref:hypothetical protein n=1 Tax=Rathayibacter sp. Leaf248 TaxID=2876555 RepID=UPI001E5A4C2C|nr:hypothetical protein [Rathayibacter sp. Leaf248]